MSKHEELIGLCSVPLALAAAGCGPGAPISLEAGVDETGGFGDTSGGGGTGGGGTGGGGTGGGDPGGSDGVAPQLVSARTDDTGKYVYLRFSEPMAPPDGVDPSDFRISQATTYTDFFYDYYGNSVQASFTSYYDPYFYFDYEPTIITNVIAGGFERDLVLEFAQPISPETCELLELRQMEIEQMKQQDSDFDARAELFPHYSPGGTLVRSAQGETVAAIGPEWVEYNGSYMWIDGVFGFPNLSPQIPIDCLVE